MRLIFLFLVIIFSNNCLGQSYKYAYYCMDSLTSKEFTGRGYLNDGDKKSANFIKRELQKSGIKPFKEKDYFQYLNIKTNNIYHASLKLHQKDNNIKIGEDFLVFGFSPSADIEIKNEKPIIFFSKKDFNIDNKKVINKILLFNQDTLRLAEIVNYLLKLQKENIFPKLAIIQGFEKIRFVQYIAEIYEVTNFPILQLKGNIFNYKIDYLNLKIESKFEPEYQSQNVIGYIEGTKCKDSLYVFTAHYDHLGCIGDSIYFAGANDNASGVAFLLDMAKYYAKNPPEYSIAFIFTTAEEIGLIGAKYFADNPYFDLNKVKFLLNFDMVGTGSGGLGLVNGEKESKASDLIKQINDKNQYFVNIVVGGESCNSDHCPFVEKGVPGLFILTHGNEYMEYHSVYDDGKKLTFTKYIDLANLIKEFIATYR